MYAISQSEVSTPMLRITLFAVTLFFVALMGSEALAQSDTHTMRPVIRGRTAAVASMKPEATEAARKILDAGGNAFDAAVAGQAALGVTDFALNGVGSDVVVLVYNARDKKVYSVNAEPKAPKLATIEWYEKNNGGKIPESDGLLSGGLPGAVDAWYTLLDRWGTMSFAQVLAPAIDLAENGFPLSESESWRDFQESPTRSHAQEAGRSRKSQSIQRPARSPQSRPRPLLQGRHRP